MLIEREKLNLILNETHKTFVSSIFFVISFEPKIKVKDNGCPKGEDFAEKILKLKQKFV